jgi:hypothetical protein
MTIKMQFSIHHNPKIFYTICSFFFPCGSTAQFWALAASMKLSVSFRLLDVGESAGLFGRVISSSQGLCVSAPGGCENWEVGRMNGFGRETEVLGQNLPRRHFVHHKSHLPDPGRSGRKPATNRFSYDAAIHSLFLRLIMANNVIKRDVVSFTS